MSVSDFQVVPEVPAVFLARMPEGGEVKRFAQFFEDGGEATLDSLELVDASYSAESLTLTAALPVNLFTDRRTQDATFAAIWSLVQTRAPGWSGGRR